MKAAYPILAAFVLLASCAPEPAQTQAEAPAISKAANPKPEPPPKPYPLKTCLVSGEDLDEMDERVSAVYQGQTFEFCCKPCLVKFKKDPQKYATKLP